MSETASVTITRKTGYQFVVDFGGVIPEMLADEPPPLGAGEGPAPQHMLIAGIANCLSASLLFALTKFKQDPGEIRTTATCTIDRNENNRLRVQNIDVSIRLGADGETLEHLDRALSQFEDFCTVSQSVRAGIPIAVTVSDARGRRLK